MEGSAYFMSQSGDAYYDNKAIAVTPALSFFVSPGTFIGGQLQYSWYEVGSYSHSEYRFGPIIGYYFNAKKERPEAKGALYPFVKAFASYGGIDSDITIIRVGGQAGATLMASNSVGITFSGQVSHEIVDTDYTSSRSGLTILVGDGLTSFIY